MGLLFSCGFNSAHWDEAALIDLFSAYHTNNLPMAIGPYGDGSLRLSQNITSVNLAANIPQVTTLRFAHWMKWKNSPTSSEVMPRWQLRAGIGGIGNILCEFSLGNTGSGHPHEWKAVENDTTIHWTGFTDPNRTTQWTWYEFEVIVSATVGTMKIWADGVLQATVIGLDTAGVDTSGPLSLAITGPGNTDKHLPEIDDFVIWDDGQSEMNGNGIGSIRIEVIQPDGDGVARDWTPKSAGANYVEVDEAIADEDTSYNESTVATDRDEFDLEAPSGEQFLGVAVHVQASRVDAGTGDVKAGIKQGASESSSDTSLASAAGYKYCSHFTSEDPDSGVAFDKAALTTAQAFYENVS